MKTRQRKYARQHTIQTMWTPLEPAVLPPEAPQHSDPNFVGVYLNSIYQVTMSVSGEWTWLAIVRRDRSPCKNWRHFQLIKNQLCGDEREAVELYPAESRLVDASNQYHLHVAPPGCCFPFGYVERDVSDMPFGKNVNEPFEIVPPDLNAKAKDRDLQMVVAVHRPPGASVLSEEQP